MNLPKFVFILSALFIYGHTVAQEDSAAGNRWLQVSFDAGLIENKTFSHFQKDYERYGHSGNMELSPVNHSHPYSLGYSFGFTCLLSLNRFSKFVLGESISQTGSEYQRKESFTKGGDLPSVSENTRVISQIIYNNLEAGFKFKLFKGLFFQHSFLYNINLKTIQKISGTKTTTDYDYNNHTAPIKYISTTETINRVDRFKDENRGSMRFTISYEFKLMKNLSYSVFVFRNFGIGYKLPWWGSGFSIIF